MPSLASTKTAHDSDLVLERLTKLHPKIIDLLRHPTPPAEVVNLPVPSAGDTHGQISAS